ncbi:MAG: hypothetical protein AAB355_02470 [Patescibacteria group bacterium]
MDPETKKVLEENLRLSQDTNEIVHKVWGAQRWARVFRILYWVFIAAAVTGVFYYIQPYIQPYIQSILGAYSGAASGIQDIQDRAQALPDAKTISNFINNIIGSQ